MTNVFSNPLEHEFVLCQQRTSLIWKCEFTKFGTAKEAEVIASMLTDEGRKSTILSVNKHAPFFVQQIQLERKLKTTVLVKC